jgi:xanthine/uracil/vitamin C permease (AzgA family)
MSSSSEFRNRVADLSREIADNTKKINIRDRCFPTAVAVGAITPFLIMLTFVIANPSILQKSEGPKTSRDPKKIFWATMGTTLVAWAGIYAFNRYHGFDRASMLCSL